MKKAAHSAGGKSHHACANLTYCIPALPAEAAYPRFIPGPDRSVSQVTALLFRCSRDGWSRRSYLEIARFSDRHGDALAAFSWIREARRCR